MGYITDLVKAFSKSDHKKLLPLFRPHIKQDSVIIDLGGHSGQAVKLFSRMAHHGHVYVFEQMDYSQSIIAQVIRFKLLKNVTLKKYAKYDSNPIILDDYIADKYIRRVDFLNVDAEELTIEIFHDATRTIDTFRPVVHTKAIAALWDFFKEKNYRIYLIDQEMSLIECSNPIQGHILCIPE